MSKAGEIAQISAKGSFHVLWGLVISTTISAFGTIFIARLLQSDLYGLYTVVVTVPMLIQIFRDWGINSAMIKFTAQYRAEGRSDEIRSIYLTGILFEITLGLLLSIFAFFFSIPLAHLFNRPVIAPLIQVISFSIMAGGIIAAATAAFTGYERMELNSLMLIGQSILKTTITITLVILGFGTAGATIGFTAGTLGAAIIGIILIWIIYRHLPKPYTHKLETKAYLTAMLTYSLPLSIATVISALLPQYYAFLLPIHYAENNIPIGNYGVAVNFVVLIAFFAQPIITMMFPAFSKLEPQKDKTALRSIFQFSVKYASLIVVPVTALVMSLAQPAVETLFGDTYNTAALFLSLLAIQYLYTSMGNLSLVGFLNGQGKTSFILKTALVTGSIGFPMGFILIMNFGVHGLIATMLTAVLPSIFMEIRFIKRTYGITIDWLSSAKILVASGIAGVSTYLLVINLPFASWIRLGVGVLFFVLVVVPALLLTRSVSRSDVANLRLMSAGLGALGRVIGKVLVLMEKLMALLRL